MRLLGFPLEGCTRISPEPAPACAEQSRSKQGRMGGDDKGEGDGRDRRCPVKPGMTAGGAGMTRKEGRCQCCRDSA